MSYPRLCKHCGKPFTGKNLYHVFCTADCGKEYYLNLKKMKPEKKIVKIEMEIKEE